MPTPAALPPAPRRRYLLFGLGLVALLAVALAFFHYFTGNEQTLPVITVPQLTPLPVALPPLMLGLDELAIRLNGYLVTQTYDVAGPYVRPDAAMAWLALLAVCLIFFLAVVSTLARPAFVAGMALLIFLLMSLNADLLGVFDSLQQYFLVLALVMLGLPAFAFHAFWPAATLGQRVLTFAVLVGALSIILLVKSNFSADLTALHLTSYATYGGAVAFALLVLWVSFENIHGLLWLNTQAENPGSRFGLLPFVLASGLYLGTLLLYYLNDGEVLILPNLRLDPFLLLLPAVLVGWLGLRRRALTYGTWVSYWPGATHLYLVLVALAAGSIGYAMATANDPLITAGRDFTALALLTCGGAFFLYVLLNFAPLIRQRLRVYRVVYEPRRLPFYIVYIIGLGALGIVELRNNFFVIDQVRAGFYNNLGDLTRLQSEQQPTNDGLALLAERYYAESDVYDRFNHRASLGRAGLYRFRSQRQNEINSLRRALSRAPSEKISLRLAALFNEPTDFFDRQKTLQEALKAPQSACLANDLAQLYTRSALTDSVLFYQARAASLAPDNEVVRANQLAFLVQNQELKAAQEFVQQNAPQPAEVALQSNAFLLAQLTNQRSSDTNSALPDSTTDLSTAEFAHIYHAGLGRLATRDTTLLPTLTQLARRPGNEAYLEQLTFLRALTQYYGGRPVAAQATLLPLLIGNSPSAAYYQQTRALWTLDQGLYATAAVYFAEATGNGFTEAALPRAYALALAGRPDSAQLQAAVAARDPNPQIARQGQRLRSILNLNFATQYASAPDSVKAQYIVLRGAAAASNLETFLVAAEAIPTPTARQTALLAQLPRVLAAGNTDAVRASLQRYAPASSTKTVATSAWNVLRGRLYLQAKQTNELRQLLGNAYFAPQHRPYQLYFQTALAPKPEEAARMYAQLVREAPFVTEGVLAAADFHAQRRDYATAYDVLLKGLDYNPESVPLLKAYALAAIRTGLEAYTEVPLEKLRTLLAPAEYATFRSQYEAQRAAKAADLAPWN